MKYQVPTVDLYQSPRLRVAIDSQQFLHIETRAYVPAGPWSSEASQRALPKNESTTLVLFAPAIMEVSAVMSSQTSGYVHFAGPFQSTTRRGDRRNFRNLGPLPAAEVHEVVAMLQYALALPLAPLDVACDELLAHPALYANRIVRSRGPWLFGAGQSSFAGAWLMAPDRWNTYGQDPGLLANDADTCITSAPSGSGAIVTIDVVGLWARTSPDARARRFPAVLDVYLLEVLPDPGELARLTGPHAGQHQHAAA